MQPNVPNIQPGNQNKCTLCSDHNLGDSSKSNCDIY